MYLIKKAEVVKVVEVPIAAAVGMDLVTKIILDNQNHLTERWRGETPTIIVSQNNRKNIGNNKLEVADWEIAKTLVMEGIMVGKKKCRFEI